MKQLYSYNDFPPEFRRYNTQYPDSEVIGWQWYDTVTYLSAATVGLVLFNAVRATIDVGNMEAAGQLAAPKAFLIRGIAVEYLVVPESVNTAAATNPETGALDNIAQLMNTGVLTLIVGAKNYSQFPLWALPSAGGAYGTISVNNILIGGAAVDYGNGGLPHAKNVYSLTKPLFLAPQINFQVNLFWPAALTLTRNTNIRVVLDGDLIRPVQ